MVRSDFAEFKGSQQNTTINSIIDENKKSLKEVHYSQKGRLINDTNFEEDLKEERQKSCSSENFLDCNDLVNDTEDNMINSQLKSMDYEIIEDALSTENYIDTNRRVIGKLEELFQIYENDSQIIQNNDKVNPGQRQLKDIIDYVLANKFDFSDVEIQIGKSAEKRNLDDFTGYYGMKNMEYSKNLFSLNLIGIQAKLKITNTLYIKEGKSVVRIVLQLAFIKISITLKTVRTNMHLAIRNYNEMGLTELYLINESNLKLQNRNEKYGDIIVNLEKDFNNLIINKHDFSNIFKEGFTEM
jgi:hypothetical protein